MVLLTLDKMDLMSDQTLKMWKFRSAIFSKPSQRCLAVVFESFISGNKEVLSAKSLGLIDEFELHRLHY